MAKKSKNHSSSIKDDEQYEALRKQGNSKEKAARIANSPTSKIGSKGGKSPSYENLNRDELYAKAKKLHIEGRSKMSKQELIQALRSH